MRVLLIEPLGHLGGHMSAHTKPLSVALAHTGVDVSLLTFDGLAGSSKDVDAKVRHISFTSKIGVFAPAFRFLPFSVVSSTICTFLLAWLLLRKERYEVIHILDCYTGENSVPLFASVVNQYGLVLTLFTPSTEVCPRTWWPRFKNAFSKRHVKLCFDLWLSRLSGTRLTIALRRFLYQRVMKKNRLAFICYTKSVHDSYSGSLFYDKIVRMFRGVEMPQPNVMTQAEARESLGLPQEGPLFLHFGDNHFHKNFEIIFQAVQGLSRNCRVLFAGKINPTIQENNPWKLASEYAYQQNTIVVDRYILEEEMQPYFRAADAVIISHRKWFAGASGVLAVACQYGLPVIAADVGDIAEMDKGCKLGLTFAPEDPQSLREALLSFLSLGEYDRQEMKRNLFHFAVAHSWQKVAQRHAELYQDLAVDKSYRRGESI